MSDAGRQDFTDKASSALKPDSQKTFGESAKENLDKAAATLQPDSTKSDSQKLGDKISGSDKSDESILDKAKNAVGLGDSK
ncbi:related to HSP12-heat shock protein [Sporisorium reilianum SRZ2]|uniref:Related to HSP12-heat shock protein n=1 Tax=Sporisorium reilianum (strain SRZ2) TaxID=999809 RepID=E6ZJU8_SPORE|nr:related to HSP12-heat shock protein [Sporisorium reilianum SRZ2]